MDRRAWLRQAGLLAAAGVAGDQLELLDRLNWKRTLFPSAQIVGNPITPDVFGFSLSRRFELISPGGTRFVFVVEGAPTEASKMLERSFLNESYLTMDYGGAIYQDVRVVGIQRETAQAPVTFSTSKI